MNKKTKSNWIRANFTVEILALLIFTFISCGQNKSKPFILKESENTIDSNEYYLSRAELLNINHNLGEKRKSQIRIWISFSLYDTGKIIDIYNDMGSWSANFLTYRFRDDTNGKLLLTSSNKTSGKPESGWELFFTKLRKLGLNTLNDHDRNSNYGLCTDANIIAIQCVDSGKYNEYIYPCWNGIKDQTQVDKVKKILTKMESELHFKIFPLDF